MVAGGPQDHRIIDQRIPHAEGVKDSLPLRCVKILARADGGLRFASTSGYFLANPPGCNPPRGTTESQLLRDLWTDFNDLVYPQYNFSARDIFSRRLKLKELIPPGALVPFSEAIHATETSIYSP
jgi:hypothetical protein